MRLNARPPQFQNRTVANVNSPTDRLGRNPDGAAQQGQPFSLYRGDSKPIGRTVANQRISETFVGGQRFDAVESSRQGGQEVGGDGVLTFGEIPPLIVAISERAQPDRPMLPRKQSASARINAETTPISHVKKSPRRWKRTKIEFAPRAARYC